jgi:L-ascorbate metabolism protein UlaG (beta-lactamase superfamily)
MRPNRRVFLKYLSVGGGTVLAGSAWWLHSSQQRAARWTRRLINDARRPILAPPAKPDPSTWSDSAIHFCWIGHSTVLINFFGVKILTDPLFGARAGVSLGPLTVGIKRYVAPALPFKALPAIDLLLLSHAHMDHMDVPTLRKFPRRTPVVTARETQDVLECAGRKTVTELAWAELTKLQTPHGDIEIEAFEVKHWGQRWPSKKARGYNGYILRRENKTILFGGDTAQSSLFRELKAKGPFAAAIMPIGAYDPWIWNHCTPEQALAMANAAGADYILPVHHQTFRLSEEPMGEPIERLVNALSSEPKRLAWRQIGETFRIT